MRHDKQTTGARSESIFFVCQKIAQKEADVQFVTTALSLSLSLSLSLALSLVPLDLPVRPGAPRPGGPPPGGSPPGLCARLCGYETFYYT